MIGLVGTHRWGAALCLSLLAIACSSGGVGASGEGGAAGVGGSNVGGATASSSSSSTGAVASSASVGAGGFGGGSAGFVCDPPAAAGSLYELSAKSYDINDIDAVSMCKYRGKVALVVNTAAI